MRLLCDRHRGVGGDGVLELSGPDEPGFVARLRIFNPDGSEAELSGNGAREAILYLRRHWTTQDTFSIQTLAGDVEATKTRTRRYAKRQLTWMRKLPGVRAIDVTGREPSDVAAELHGMIGPA